MEWQTEFCSKIGKFVAEMDLSLKSFHHPAYETRTLIWFLHNVPQVREFLYAVKDEANRKLSEELIKAFEDEVLPLHVRAHFRFQSRLYFTCVVLYQNLDWNLN